MRKITFAASLVLGASLLSGPAMAIPASGPASMPLPSDTQQIQFFFGGRGLVAVEVIAAAVTVVAVTATIR